MDWFSYWFSWYTILPCFLAYVVTPAAAFVFFGRFCGTFVKWGWCALYVLFYMGVIGLEYLFHIKGCGGLVMEVVLLAVFGWIAFGRPRREVLAAAALTQSVLSVTGGILSWIDHRVFSPLVMSMSRQTLIRSGDGVRELLKALGILALFFAVLKIFGKTIEEPRGRFWSGSPCRYFLSPWWSGSYRFPSMETAWFLIPCQGNTGR